MNASAPNLPCAGAQSSEVTNDRPSFRKAGHASFVVEYAMRARTTRTARPATRVTPRKMRSAQTSPALPCVSSGLSGSLPRAVRVDVMVLLLADLDLVELGNRLLGQVGRDRCVAGLRGEVALTVGEDPVQPRLHRVAL